MAHECRVVCNAKVLKLLHAAYRPLLAGLNLFYELVELNVVKMPIEFILFQKLPMRSRCLDAAFMQQEDLIAGTDGRDSVREENHSPPGQDAGKGIVEEGLDVFFQREQRLFNN